MLAHAIIPALRRERQDKQEFIDNMSCLSYNCLKTKYIGKKETKAIIFYIEISINVLIMAKFPMIFLPVILRDTKHILIISLNKRNQ